MNISLRLLIFIRYAFDFLCVPVLCCNAFTSTHYCYHEWIEVNPNMQTSGNWFCLCVFYRWRKRSVVYAPSAAVFIKQ